MHERKYICGFNFLISLLNIFLRTKSAKLIINMEIILILIAHYLEMIILSGY